LEVSAPSVLPSQVVVDKFDYLRAGILPIESKRVRDLRTLISLVLSRLPSLGDSYPCRGRGLDIEW
jgi:hypothetical protein